MNNVIHWAVTIGLAAGIYVSHTNIVELKKEVESLQESNEAEMEFKWDHLKGLCEQDIKPLPYSCEDVDKNLANRETQKSIN